MKTHQFGLDLSDYRPDGDGGDDGAGSGDGDGGGSGDGGAGTRGDDSTRTFSQADVDRIVQERVARVKKEAPADYDDLKTKAAEFDKIQEANKTELQKVQDRAEALERERTAAVEIAHATKIESAIVAEAAKRGVDTDIAVAMLDRKTLEFDDAGSPTNVASAMDSLLQAKPSLAGGARGGSADQGARGGNGVSQISRDEIKNMKPDQILAAQREGRLDAALGRG